MWRSFVPLTGTLPGERHCGLFGNSGENSATPCADNLLVSHHAPLHQQDGVEGGCGHRRQSLCRTVADPCYPATRKTLSNTVIPSRSPILAPLTALTAGAVLGVLGPLLESAGSPMGHVAHLVLSAGWTWAALAFCVGLTGRSRTGSAVLAPACLSVGVITYYAAKLQRGEFREFVALDDPSQGTHIYWAGFASKIIFWCLAAVALGAPLGLAGSAARESEYRSLVFRILIPLVAVVEMVMRLRTEAPLQGRVAYATWSVTLLAAVSVIAALVVRAIITNGVRGRKQRAAGTPGR
ncbi:hypothetical protein SsS58_08048 [Streptomyces scabiei]|uniref:Uncharacterized protein n=1 Tax=Streptomyces scabiei TaxID=1930 RepID=A0A100JXQ4_STRSC|nr:hypothetical protein SsS58_08048 [Streptomyces scabiei]